MVGRPGSHRRRDHAHAPERAVGGKRPPTHLRLTHRNGVSQGMGMRHHDVEPIAEVADLDLVDHHCHGVSAAPLHHDAFVSLLTEGGRDMLGAIDPIASPLGLAIRSLCAPVLDVDPHAPIEEYMKRRSALGEDNVARRMLAGAGLSDLLIDTGYLSDQLLAPAAMMELGRFRTHEIVRIEAVAEEVFASAGSTGFVDEFARTLGDRARSAVGLKSIVAYRAGLDVGADRPSVAATSEALARWSPGSRLEDAVLLRPLPVGGGGRGRGVGHPDPAAQRVR